MSAVVVERITEEQAIARRTEILDAVGDVDGFRDRAENYRLSMDEQALFDELEDLEYLLSL